MDENALLQELASPKRVEPRLWDPLVRQTPTEFVISVIVPTKNEAGNIEPLLSRIDQATRGIPTEVVFVDDSSDETPQVIRNLQDRCSLQVTLIDRPSERRGNGLGGAVVEGLQVARAPWVCVMDGDLQHPPELIPELLKQAEATGADIVVGSRLAPGGDVSSLGPRRTLISRLLAVATRATFPVRLRKVTDPLSGLFIARRAAINLDSLRPDGFKILLEILIRCPDLRVSEIPIRFGHRHAGESKASIREVLRFFRLLLRLRPSGDQHFARFLAVGASGLVVNNLVLAVLTELAGLHYLLSAVLATQASTLWNFGLTEAWVFGQRKAEHPFLHRLIGFLLMNNLALLLRGPLLSFMVAQLGVHYLLSNLISLCAITLLRYLVAEQWLWAEALVTRPAMSDPKPVRRPVQMIRFNRHTPEAPKLAPQMGAPAQAERFMFHYDIHGLVSLVSEVALPELEAFRVSQLVEKPLIRVQLGWSKATRLPAEGAAEEVRRLVYDEHLGPLGFWAKIERGRQIQVTASPLLRWSPHVLYTNLVEPVLRWYFVEQGYALVHGACLDFEGRAYLITARTDTGKTTSLLRILSRQRRGTDKSAFISDDLTLLSPDGKVLTYPKPLTISLHTVQAIRAQYLSWRQRIALVYQSRVHSRSGRRLAHRLGRTKLPMATINALVQWLVPPPKYHIQQLVPGAKLARESKLAGMFIIERFWQTGEARLSHDEALDILLSNCEDAYGFPPYDAIKRFLYQPNGHDLRVKEQQIMAQALQGLPTMLVTSRNLDWWRRIPALVDANLAVCFTEPNGRSRRANLGQELLPAAATD